jgi:hypothetical protein
VVADAWFRGPGLASRYPRPVRSVSVLLIAVIVALTWLAVPADVTAANMRTQVTVFEAFSPAGSPSLPATSASGYCSTGSLVADRSDAWRCLAGNQTYDPCFSTKANTSVVACPNEALTSDVEIHLTRPLPTPHANQRAASANDRRWLIVLGPKCFKTPSAAKCYRCKFKPGTKLSLNGMRPNYDCGPRGHLRLVGFGVPNRSREPWTMYYGFVISKRTVVTYGTPTAMVHAWM